MEALNQQTSINTFRQLAFNKIFYGMRHVTSGLLSLKSRQSQIIFGLFYDVLSNSDHNATNNRMVSETQHISWS
jgi:hypothetical protein